MKALALKLAALSAGTAAAASAATAKAAASTTAGGAAAASTGAFSLAKVAVSVALFGATITGAVVWQGKVSVRQGAEKTPVVQVAPAAQQAEVEPAAEQQLKSARLGKDVPGAPSAIEAAPSLPNEGAPMEFEAAEPEGNSVVAAKARVTSPADESVRSVRSSSVRTTSASRARSSVVETPAAKPSAAVGVSSAKSTEVDLLRRARAALASRPREAFAITQEHREQYPSGMFAQERDALAIEALMRAGEMGTARTLAERFVREHPSSPHAHRFRETMDLR